ncbi:MAG: sugar ABC transporter permease [Anaerolineae bacterium]|nr:sugar ABC transporter permease [Anaerolineae bacterium]
MTTTAGDSGNILTSFLPRPVQIALRTWLSKRSTQGYLMVAPAVLWLLILLAYPFILAIWIAFTNKTVGQPGEFIGLANFTRQWDSMIFRRAFLNTFVYTAAATIVKLGLGFGLALLLNQAFIGRRFVRATILLPWIVPTVLSAMVWKWMFDPNLSSINWVLRNMGLITKNIPWLTDPTMAMVSIIIVNVWRGIPFFAITLLAALQTVPQELYDAASIDGAGPLQRLRKVTVPLTMPVMVIVTIVSIIGTLGDIQVVYSLTRGGPNNSTQVLATLSQTVGLSNGQLGQGAAIALHMLPFLIVLVFLEVWNMRRSEH